MPWNPEIYNQFKSIRYQPFFDLMDLISDKNLHNAVDIGCGTGEQTAILSQKFENCNCTGIDSSVEMLSGSEKFENNRLHFKHATIEDFVETDSNWDLIFSNAALQWSDNHEVLFPKLISKLNPSGQFAVQMPFQKENSLNQILLELVREQPFSDYLNGFTRESPLLSLDDYAQILFENGLTDINISLKVYPIIANDETDLFNFISGSALIPYMELLNDENRKTLKSEFLKRIKMHFKKFPAIYSFKRILLYGIKN